MRYVVHVVALLGVLCFPLVGDAAKPLLDAIELESGDTLVFCGDSITHQCLYTQYVEDFFYTRYPERQIRFHNAGIGGDRAFDALMRFDRDIAAYQPKYVTILLGMNDGTYADFDRAIFDTYAEDMTELLDRLEAIDAQPIVMTPTMFDHVNHFARMDDETYRGRTRDRSPYYNAVLAFYGTWLRDVACERGLGFVNMWGPLNDLTLAARKSEAEFTLIPDSIHPAENGQAVMAVSILADLTPDRKMVGRLVANRRANGNWKVNATAGEVEEAEGTAEGLSFVYTAQSLPWVLPPEASLGYAMTQAGRRLSSEKIQVVGLAPGKYELRIDGVCVEPSVTHVRLAAGLALQSNDKTPQYRQALAVAMLNKQRNDEAVHPLRDLWRQPKAIWRSETIDANKLEAKMVEIEPEILELEALAADYEARIYEAAQPVAHTYEIVRVKE